MKKSSQENAEGVSGQAGRRSRRLLLLERTMYREGCTPFTSVFPLHLVGTFQENRLRNALARVQAKHPLLRCVVEEKTNGPCFVMQDQPAPIPLRVVERQSEDHWQVETRREWTKPFTQEEPLVRLVWLRGDGVHELILLAHHCICDGHSGIHLLHDLLRVYDEPEQELGSYEALGTVEDLVPAEGLRDRKVRSQARRNVLILRTLSLLKRLLPQKPAAPQVAPEQIYFHRWSVDRAAVEGLTERCRAENTTILAAASIAFMQAFRDVRGVKALNKTYTMVNARRFLPRLGTDALFGLVPGVPLLMKDLPQPQEMGAESFWQRARSVKTAMTAQMDRLGAGLYATLLTLEAMHDSYASMVTDTERAAVARHVTLSNMGRIDLPQQYGDFRLERIYSPLVMVSPTPANTVVLSSFGGVMEFAIISDEHSLPHMQATAIAERAMQILRAVAPAQERHAAVAAHQPSAMQVVTT
ncbi:condensation domain-containing protein [Granulicella mallensis]|uniref:Condensation domain protein n=1 Tax=Granulicella mallensis (strain ATCC BAA-1857 / DSM 23137 / MP5ACTX8) TaxID=682795 RepID=G8NQ03_GRAMM|nr:condensation domain-containing protein [Granulicella mallensis]AEU38337.1 condensation domain protein [Granulicella mallensis MP5ACTX8]